jgi:hypothetical protein
MVAELPLDAPRPDAVEAYIVRSFDYVVDYLNRRGEAIAAGLDPIGEENLGLSKRIRRMALREGQKAPAVLVEVADDFFPMPKIGLGEIAVVGDLLLSPQRAGHAGDVPQSRRALPLRSRALHPTQTIRFEVERALHTGEGVQILDLRPHSRGAVRPGE